MTSEKQESLFVFAGESPVLFSSGDSSGELQSFQRKMNVTCMVITTIIAPQTQEELAPEDWDQPECLCVAFTFTNKYI